MASAAADQYYLSLKIAPRRGEIRTSDGSIMATNRVAYLVYAEPQKIKDNKIFVDNVAHILNLDKELISQRISDTRLVWSLLKHKVDEETYQKLQEAHLSGLGFEKESVRYYPEGSMAAQLLGFVGQDETGEDKGYFGVEGYYDRALRGAAGSLLQEKDANGLPILLGVQKRISAENGQDLELYLDRTVQFIVENKLKQGIDKYGAKAGSVVVMDQKTGGILGMTAFPSYDQREFSQYSQDVFSNPLVSYTYEPGSTFKSLVMSSGLNERVIEPSTKFNEDGPIPINEYLIRTWNNEYHGELTMTQVLEKSSNPGMVFVARQLGKDKLFSYIQKFGFGEKTNIDLQEEVSPEIRPLSRWKEIDLATASFGQGIAVTPIQMVKAVATLANGGILMEPHIVKKIINTDGKVNEIHPRKIAEILRPATSRMITEMMVSAVDKGEAKWAKPPGYRIAGKTGTAQIPVAGHYDDKKTIASFVGFAPADNPKFVMLVTLREPSSSQWGSETAAPLFFSIAKDLFAYYGISPKD